MILLNKFLKVFIWICIFASLAIMAKGAMDAHYGMDKGLNSDANPILLLPEEAQTSQNMYYQNKKIIKRWGSEHITDYTAGTDVSDINGIESIDLSDQGLFNSQNWELIFTTNSSDQAIVDIRTTQDNTEFYRVENTLYNFFPTLGPWLTNGREGDFNYAVDCATVSDFTLCGVSNLGFSQVSDRAFAIGLFRFDPTIDTNLIYDFEDVSEFSCTSNCTSLGTYDAYADVKHGTTGVEFNKTAGGATGVVSFALDNSINIAGYLAYQVYVNINGSANLAKISSMRVGFSTAGYGTDYILYTLSGLAATGQYYELSGSTTTSGSTDTANINYIIIQVTTIGADTLSDVRADVVTFAPQVFDTVGPAAPGAAVTTAAGAAGALTGTYKYVWTCTDFSGTESNASAASSGTTVSAKKIDISNIAASSQCPFDTQYVDLYRIKNGGTVYYHLTQLTAENTTYTDNTADSSLDTTDIAPQSGTVNDNSRPYYAKYVESFKNRFWLAGFFNQDTVLNLSRVVYSDYTENGAEPGSFRTNDYLDIDNDDGQEIRALKTMKDSLYVFKEHSIYEVIGDTPDNFASVLVSTDHGAISNRAVVSDGNVIYFLDRFGIYAFDGDNFLEISQPIRNIFVDSSISQKEGYAFAEYYPDHKQVWFVIPSSPTVASPGASTAYIYHIDTGAWSTYVFKNNGSCQSTELTALRYVQESIGRSRMHIGTGDKYVLRYGKDTSGNILYADSSSCTIAASWRSKCFFQTEGGNTPTNEKIYDYAYLIADSESSGDVSFDWGYDWNYSTVNSETVSLINSSSNLVTQKIYLSGATGNNKSMWFGFSDTSSTDTFSVHGVEVHYNPSGGER